MPKNRNKDLPALSDCIKGRVYKLYCRNLLLGVYDGDGGFIGIRTKLGCRYLFTEYHWDHDPHCGTVSEAIDLSIDVPNGIFLTEDLGAKDERSERKIEWDEKLKSKRFPNGWWKYCDTGETDEDIRPVAIHNDELFNFLEALEKKGLGD